MKNIYIYILLITLLVSCDASQDILNERVPIELGAEVQNMGASTRAPYSLTTPSISTPLSASVWMSTTSHEYANTTTAASLVNETAFTDIHFHNSATFTGSTKQLLNTQMYYPSNKSQMYFVGLYPYSDDGNADNDWALVTETVNKAEYIFDGKTDVMFAPEVSNGIETSAKYPVLQFQHLLTWLRIQVYASTEENISTWGKITSIKLVSKDKVTVNLADNTATFSEDTQLPTYLTDTDTPCTGQAIELTTTPTEIAYVLCAPVTATTANDEYELILSTENRSDISVSVNLRAANNTNFYEYTAGHQFTVTLKFVEGDNILTTAQITPWSNGGYSTVSVGE